MRLWVIVIVLMGVPVDAFADVGLPKPGDVIARVVVEASLARHRVMQPMSLAPDLVVGVRDRTAIAWHHSRMFDGRLGAGNGICLVGARETLGMAPADCGSGYAGGGLSVLYGLAPSVTLRGGITAVDVSPMTLAFTAGAVMGVGGERLWSTFAPTIFSGVTHRERGNREHLYAPLYIGANVGPGEMHLRSGVEATLETATETFSVPLGVGGSFAPGGGFRIGAELTLDRALGMLNGMAWRSASIYIELDHGGRS